MNQNQVLEALLLVHAAREEFSVVFSGRHNFRVNGYYRPFDRMIVIHNKNFSDDNSLMYTALHEYAHHIHGTELGADQTGRAHTTEFWATFHELLAAAEAAGVYVSVFSNPLFCDGTTSIMEQLAIQGETAAKIGLTLLAIQKLCITHKTRFEDYLDRVLRMPRTTARMCIATITHKLDTSRGYDGIKFLAGMPSAEARERAQAALDDGKTPAEVKQLKKISKAIEDDHARLAKEKARLSRAIEILSKKLAKVDKDLEEVQAKDDRA